MPGEKSDLNPVKQQTICIDIFRKEEGRVENTHTRIAPNTHEKYSILDLADLTHPDFNPVEQQTIVCSA